MKLPSSIRKKPRAPETDRRAGKPRASAAPEPRRTRARPNGSTRALIRPRPVRTVYGRAIMADLALAGRNRTDLATALECSVSRVHQVLRDRRMDDDPGRDAVMDGWRERIRAALEAMTPPPAPALAPVPQPPVEPVPDAPAAPEVRP